MTSNINSIAIQDGINSKINNSQISELIKIKLGNKFQSRNNTIEEEEQKGLDKDSYNFKRSLLNRAAQVYGKRRNKQNNPWCDEDCGQTLQDRSCKKNKLLNICPIKT